MLNGMLGKKWYKKLYYIKSVIKQHISKYKVFYCIALICFLIGIVTGVLTGIKYASLIDSSHIPDRLLINFLSNQASVFGVLFSRIIDFVFLIILVFLLCLIPLASLLNFIIIIYKSYLLSLTFVFVIVLYGFSGLLLSLFIILPCGLLFIFALSSIICVACERSINSKKYGFAFFSDCQPKFPTKLIAILFCFAVIAAIVEIILLPIISVTFVIIV